MNSPTAAITLTQIAALADLGPDYFSRHADALPPTHPVHTGSRGRPQKAFDIDDLAALIVERTGHLSEAVVRLRLALSTAPLRIVQVGEKHVLVRDDEELSDLQPDVRDALMRRIHADNETALKRRTSRTQPVPEEPQP
ncbi:hypothetical protein C5609_15710 [Pseudomonas putida]|uniref:hypothetical protein n=1 Tax=Pseudomonas putida TaxID=303 RepID=UPI00106FEC6B|nr:hypothetical protein [Pseudomonas putida]TFF51034.1 hypothetical protein C5609_15710 [Pseudomonas putida]